MRSVAVTVRNGTLDPAFVHVVRPALFYETRADHECVDSFSAVDVEMFYIVERRFRGGNLGEWSRSMHRCCDKKDPLAMQHVTYKTWTQRFRFPAKLCSYIRKDQHTKLHTCTYLHAHLHIHACTPAHTCMHTCTYLHVHLHTPACTTAHTCMHICLLTKIKNVHPYKNAEKKLHTVHA